MLLLSYHVRILRRCRQSPLGGYLSVGALPASARSQLAIRTLFELQAGRQRDLPPANLFIDEGKSVLSQKNENPRSTSKELIEALGKLGEEYRRPREFEGKNDLSYSDAATAALDWKEARRQVAVNIEAGRDEQWGLHPKDVLIDYLRHVVPVIESQTRLKGAGEGSKINDALLRVFNRRNEIYLTKRGWGITDLMDWAWILAGDTAERASRRLSSIGASGMRGSGRHKSVPQFIHIFLLRRRTINAPALRTLLAYTWDYMEWLSQENVKVSSQEVIPEHRSNQLPKMEEYRFMLIIIRLLRSARKVMPAACESIVALFCRHLDSIDSRNTSQAGGRGSAEDRSAALAFMYNSLLQLVAVPASIHPFRSATHQQRAQFTILRRMTQFDPPLAVDRRGYRAVTQMQLMHKKTSREREWAHLKSQSWPPWRDDRLRIYADIDPDHGISRAREVLNQAREAGYATDDWDDAASILSGWDTDYSPTIQTRAMLKDTVKNADERSKNLVWAARIKATRTLPEAWAAFLAYEDSGIKRFAVPYAAMFEKLFFGLTTELAKKDSLIIFENKQRDDDILPGDSPKVYPPPVLPRDAIYVRVPPPSIDVFLQKMIDDGIKPRASGEVLMMLLRHAPSLATGVRFLKCSNLPAKFVKALLTHRTKIIEDAESQELVAKVPAKLFAAFIALLTRFAGRPASRVKGANPEVEHISMNKPNCIGEDSRSIVDKLSPISQAIWLVHCRKPRERAPWYSILAALACTGIVTPLMSYTSFRSYSAIANWKTSCWLLECMEELDVALDLAAIKILCTGLEKAIFEAEQIISQKMGIENVHHIPRSDLELVLDKGLPLIKQVFKEIVRSDQMQQEVPQFIRDNQGRTNPPLQSLLETDEDSTTDSDDEDFEDEDEEATTESENYLPPACLLPKVLEVPHPAQLHSFIRILGLRRDYQGMLDLIEWMALFSDEIRAITEEQRNGKIMMRRCLTAVRVFLERSWLHHQEAGSRQAQLSKDAGDVAVAPVEIWQVVHDTVVETQHWGGWPTNEEVERYCKKGLFL